ncbi:MAG: Spy/CpxP family protein refolding chaperone [Methylococcales bacterium]|jgi:Spy/CpxP family protein refolding chaperone|nr:Spy/CpxP family protein refolding chaperone [Methylococcales bacterium]MBT7445238.1 Spy/CpxP family protein refolding chaperone [Methylococcales bacterium]
MRKNKLMITAILAGSLLAIGATGVSYACGNNEGASQGQHHSQYRGHHRGHHNGDRMSHWVKQLNLTDDQRAVIEKIRGEHKVSKQDNRQQLKAIKQALRQQIHSDNFDAAKVRELANAKAKIIVEMTVQRAEMKHLIRQELTPEQRNQFNDMKGHRFQKQQG